MRKRTKRAIGIVILTVLAMSAVVSIYIAGGGKDGGLQMLGIVFACLSSVVLLVLALKLVLDN